eukprot:m51a1_g10899 hypothetical protein (343) ;mRNA; f:30993-32451
MIMPTFGDYEEPFSVFPAYGVPRGEFASYYERATLAWYNVVRTAPSSFRHDYISPLMKQGDASDSNVFGSGSLPAVSPIPWNLNLNRAARAHSADVAAHCPKQLIHDDCNGTSIWTRIKQFYTSTGSTGEIFAPLGFDGFDVMHWPAWSLAAWVCDGFSVSSGSSFSLSTCPGDGESSAGHRQNIMTIGGEVGCGVAILDGMMISTCDMSSQKSPYNASQVLIASGAHVTDYTNKGQFYFIASASSRVSSASVIIDGHKTDMSKYGGSLTYITDKTAFTSTEDCHTYYFRFDKARYPATGAFKTYGIGSCKADYDSSAGDDGGVAATAIATLLWIIPLLLLL